MINLAGIPLIYYSGEEGLNQVLVMELLGPNLDDLHSYCNKKFSLKTTLILADLMVILCYIFIAF